MKKFLKVLGILSLLLVFTGCIKQQYVIYDVSLNEVERPTNAKKRYGKSNISSRIIDNKGVDTSDTITKFTFKDKMISITIQKRSNGFTFDLKNKTSHSLKIIWDEAVYIDTEGKSHRVLHEGIKLMQKDNPQTPTVIARNGTISDAIFVSDYFILSGYKWINIDLLNDFASLENSSDNILKRMRDGANGYLNKNIQILLPIKIENIVNEYIFIFNINSFKVIKYGKEVLI
jgi:hypothetical protein